MHIPRKRHALEPERPDTPVRGLIPPNPSPYLRIISQRWLEELCAIDCVVALQADLRLATVFVAHILRILQCQSDKRRLADRVSRPAGGDRAGGRTSESPAWCDAFCMLARSTAHRRAYEPAQRKGEDHAADESPERAYIVLREGFGCGRREDTQARTEVG